MWVIVVCILLVLAGLLAVVRWGGLSVAVFAALVVFHGVLVAALAGRLSRTLPLLSLEPRALAGHALLLLLVLLAPLGLIAAVVGVAVVLVSRVPGMAAHAGRLMAVGRVALALVGLVALPVFAEAIVDILGRGR